MIRKIGSLGIGLFCLASLISCEEDFDNIGTNVVNNNQFNAESVDLELKISPVSTTVVRADNIGANITEYWLGVYNSKNYKTVNASFVSQIGFLSNPKTSDVKSSTDKGDIDSTFILDKVVLKLPYAATNKGKDSNNKTKWLLDSLLGDASKGVNLQVLENETFLNTLDPSNPSQSNSFQSNHAYLANKVLNEDANFMFQPNPNDTILKVTRHHGNGTTFESEEKLATKGPFLSIPLSTAIMKDLFWDKFNGSNFSSADALNNYFKGLLFNVTGTDGAMVPLSLLGTTESASLDFYYTITRKERLDANANYTHKDTVPTKYSFPLSGVRNVRYSTAAASVAPPANNFVIQGTTGTQAKVEVLGINLAKLRASNPNHTMLKYASKDADSDGYLSLKELATIRDVANGEYGLLVNDAALTFNINQTVNTDKNIIPQQLFVYTSNSSGDPIQMTDAHTEATTYGGKLILASDKPEKYTFRITDYVSNILDRSSTDISPLFLKVYNNPTDSPYRNRVLDTSILTYNWNPRGVTLLNEDETTHSEKRAVLRLSYSVKK